LRFPVLEIMNLGDEGNDKLVRQIARKSGIGVPDGNVKDLSVGLRRHDYLFRQILRPNRDRELVAHLHQQRPLCH